MIAKIVFIVCNSSLFLSLSYMKYRFNLSQKMNFSFKGS